MSRLRVLSAAADGRRPFPKVGRAAAALFLGLAALLVPSSCTHLAGQPATSARRAPCIDLAPDPPDSFAGGTLSGSRWLCQLQGASPQALAATGFDTVVLDYSSDGSEEGRYGKERIAGLKQDGRQVLAYLSIGEAEDYRYYFDPRWVSLFKRPARSAPCWLGRTNPQWPGNYKVQYWSDDWQQTILGYLDRIIEDGYDGVFLDIIDAYQYWSDPHNGEGFSLAPQAAAVRMIRWVKRIAYHARVIRGKADFLIVAQNGEGLLEYDSGVGGLGTGDYLRTISAQAVEDLYYNGTRANDPEEVSFRRHALERVQAAGKKVLVLDYVDGGSRPVTPRVLLFLSRALADGFLPYAARSDRALDEINTFPGQPRE